jgi:hypothetical protein
LQNVTSSYRSRCRCYVSCQDQVRFSFLSCCQLRVPSRISYPTPFAYRSRLRSRSPPALCCSSPRCRQYVSNASPPALHAFAVDPCHVLSPMSTVHGSCHASSVSASAPCSIHRYPLTSHILPAQPGFPCHRYLRSSALSFAHIRCSLQGYPCITAAKVAVIMPGTGEQPVDRREIVLHSRACPRKRISELHSAYLPLCYPIIHYTTIWRARLEPLSP